jgi:hypothetical protein
MDGELPSHSKMPQFGRPDPIENAMAMLLSKYGIEYTRPEHDAADPTTLDFYLPAFRLYIEVKQFHTDRIAGQLRKVPQMTTAIVLVGPTCINDFARLVENMRPG